MKNTIIFLLLFLPLFSLGQCIPVTIEGAKFDTTECVRKSDTWWRQNFILSEPCRAQLWVDNDNDGDWDEILRNRLFIRSGSPFFDNWYNVQSTHKDMRGHFETKSYLQCLKDVDDKYPDPCECSDWVVYTVTFY